MTDLKAEAGKKRREWLPIVKKYQNPNVWKSTWQVINSLVPFLALWVLMYYSLRISYVLTLALAVVNAGFVVRIFIIQHDCGHGSFYKSKKANNLIGSIFGVLTLTPYYHWRKKHAKHHANSGDLDFRGFGDVDTKTVAEYKAMSRWERFKYRFYRNPFVMFVLGPFFVFVIENRLPLKIKKSEKKERASVHLTNLALAILILGIGSWIGFKEFFLIQTPISLIAATVGVFLFYFQHQFEDTYWRWHEDWDYQVAALEGSSYFKLPKVLQWFTGNIGFHHVHHLSPLIPNYLLERAHNENPIFHDVETLNPVSCIKMIFLDLWDEERNKLISFRQYRKLYVLGAN